MSTEIKASANVRVRVTSFMLESQRIPKMIELFDRSLKVVWSQWYETDDFIIYGLNPGTYTLRLSMSSKIQKDETFDLEENETKEININVGFNSPHESHERVYLSKRFSMESFRDTNMKAINYQNEPGKLVSGQVWKYSGDQWVLDLNIIPFNSQTIHRDGNIFYYTTDERLSILEITGQGMENLYICLPPGNYLNCLIKLAETGDAETHPIDVTVSTDNFMAETLLALLTNGAIREAQTLTNARDAERLLFEKMVNPVTAAIGGYFLLKIGELERLHGWANNLANWFPWLADGAIIHATQLLNTKE